MRRRRALGTAAVLALAVTAAAFGLPARAGTGGPDPFAVLGAGGAWSYFSDPRAVHLDGACACTYSGWVNSQGDLVVGALDESSHHLHTSVLMARVQVNDHASPSLLALPDHRLAVFWSAHQGRAIYLRTMTRPDDIRSFGPLRTLPVGIPGDEYFTYTNPVLLPGEHNRIYLFWRSRYSHQAFATSDDLGVTWSASRLLVEQPFERPYVKYDAYDSTIAMAFTRSHPDTLATPVYYMAYRQGALLRADGSPIGPLSSAPVSPDAAGVVGDTGAPGANSWVQDVAFGRDGLPVVAYVTAGPSAPHIFHYARFDGAHWQDTPLADAGPSIDQTGREPSYTGGMSLDHDDPRTVYLSRRAGSANRVERWVTLDGGVSFTSTIPVQDLTLDNLRPAVVRNHASSGPEALWMSGSYRHFTDYSTSIVTTPIVIPPSPSATAAAAEVRPPRRSRRPTIAATLTLGPGGPPVVGAEMTLFVRPKGFDSWIRWTQSTTDADGQVSFLAPTSASAEFQVLWPGDDRWAPSTSPTAAWVSRR